MSFGEDIGELVERHSKGRLGIHPTWSRVRAGDVAELTNGFAYKSAHFDAENGEPLLRIRDILTGKPGTFYNAPVDDPKMKSVKNGDIVVGMDGDFNSRIWDGGEALVNQRVCTLKADETVYSQRLLAYALPGYLSLIHDHTSSVTVKHLSSRTVHDIPLPLPPLNEQHRIVEKIETLFAHIDKGEEALREVQKLLKRYRQSILKAAVTGELTRDWREANQHKLEPASDLLARILVARRESCQGPGKYKDALAPEITALSSLPEGWRWATMDQLGEVLGGLTKNRKRLEMPLKRPMLRVANVYQNRLNLEDIHETGVSEKELERVALEPMDILIVEGNGSKDQIGRMAIWRDEIADAVHQNHLIKARLFEKRLAEYTLAWFQSPAGRQVIEIVASSTSGLYTLSLSKIKQLTVPLPSLPEAQEIITKIEELHAQADRAEEILVAELRRSASLRQSILKSAFTGQLVPQDPKDEPASELLARIRAEQSRAPKKELRQKARA